MRSILLAAAVMGLLQGCADKPMTNDQIIAEVKKCNDAGLKATEIINGWDYSVVRIVCEPK